MNEFFFLILFVHLLFYLFIIFLSFLSFYFSSSLHLLRFVCHSFLLFNQPFSNFIIEVFFSLLKQNIIELTRFKNVRHGQNNSFEIIFSKETATKKDLSHHINNLKCFKLDTQTDGRMDNHMNGQIVNWFFVFLLNYKRDHWYNFLFFIIFSFYYYILLFFTSFFIICINQINIKLYCENLKKELRIIS